MKRPSNLIIAFILAIAATFIAYAVSRLFFRAIAPPKIEIEEDLEDLESQRYVPHVAIKSEYDLSQNNTIY